MHFAVHFSLVGSFTILCSFVKNTLLLTVRDKLKDFIPTEISVEALDLFSLFDSSSWKDFIRILEHDIRCTVNTDTVCIT